MRQIERIPCELIQRSNLLISHRNRLWSGHDRIRGEAVRLKVDRTVLEFDILDHVRRDLDGRVVGDDRGGVVFVGGVDYGGGGVASCVAVAGCAAVAAVFACATIAGCAAVAAVFACAAITGCAAVAACSAIGVALACIS